MMFHTESRVVLFSEMFHCVIRTWSERHSRYSPCAIPPGSPVGFRWPSSSYGQLLIAPCIPASIPILAGGMVDGTYSNPRTTSEWPPQERFKVCIRVHPRHVVVTQQNECAFCDDCGRPTWLRVDQLRCPRTHNERPELTI